VITKYKNYYGKKRLKVVEYQLVDKIFVKCSAMLQDLVLKKNNQLFGFFQ
jgi:hypothetical protein